LRLIAILPCLMLGLLMSGCSARSRLSERDHGRIAGKTFVITGASSGFGRGVALKLAAHGANVVLAARREAVLEEVAAEARAAGGTPLVVPTDVSRPEEIQRLADAAVARFGRIDVWINNVGIGAIGRFDDVPVADHARIVDVNLKGVIYGSHAALRQFRRQGAGTLVNIGSVESRVPLPYHASYAATKHAVLGLGVALRQELRLSGAEHIQVATVLPWAVDTPWWDHAANYSGHTPRMVPMDGPEDTVDTIVWASIHPGKEMPVGWKATGALLAHRAMPGLTERLSANAVHGAQIEAAPPQAPPTTGTLYEPVMEGTGVSGGTRARIEREDSERQGGR
jgi:short-subunit dehydrogenase